jgi:DNA mismatch endonuclease (patch repair protein)
VPDNLRPEDRVKAMRAVKGTNTSLERIVYAAFQARGWRCARNVADLPGKPDFVFKKARLVVFVDGDFWHGWRFPQWCEKLTPYWKKKIERNRLRDRLNFQRLRRAGWRVLRLWGHNVERDLAGAVAKVSALLAAGPALIPAPASVNSPLGAAWSRTNGDAHDRSTNANFRRRAESSRPARRRRG